MGSRNVYLHTLKGYVGKRSGGELFTSKKEVIMTNATLRTIVIVAAASLAACTEIPSEKHISSLNSSTGGSNFSSSAGSNPQTAQDVANDVYGGIDTHEIDPGPVVDHSGVKDVNGNGSSDDEAEAVTTEGSTQADAQPDKAADDEPSTNSGNAGVDIF